MPRRCGGCEVNCFPIALLVVRKRFLTSASPSTSCVSHHSSLHTDLPLLCKTQIRFGFPICAASFGAHNPKVCRALKQTQIRCKQAHRSIAESGFGLSKGFTRPQVLYHGLHKMNLANVMRLGISDLHTEESEEILDDCKLHAKSNSLSDSCLVTSLAG